MAVEPLYINPAEDKCEKSPIVLRLEEKRKNAFHLRNSRSIGFCLRLMNFLLAEKVQGSAHHGYQGNE